MNKDTAHTPGPWRVAPAADYLSSDINVDAGKRGYICLAGVRGDTQAEANARLIAAAPDLLRALDNLLEQHMAGVDLSVRDRHEWLRAAAAVARATGVAP